MNKPAWIEIYCDDAAILEKLNNLDDSGYMPWNLSHHEVQDTQDPCEPKEKGPNSCSFEIAEKVNSKSALTTLGRLLSFNVY